MVDVARIIEKDKLEDQKAREAKVKHKVDENTRSKKQLYREQRGGDQKRSRINQSKE